MKTTMNGGVTAITLIDCIALIPFSGESRARPGITNDENA